jgi:hypothetical protein
LRGEGNLFVILNYTIDSCKQYGTVLHDDVCAVEYSLEQDEPWVQGSIIPNINQFPILNMNEASKELEIPFHKVTLLILCSFPVVSEQILAW